MRIVARAGTQKAEEAKAEPDGGDAVTETANHPATRLVVSRPPERQHGTAHSHRMRSATYMSNLPGESPDPCDLGSPSDCQSSRMHGRRG